MGVFKLTALRTTLSFFGAWAFIYIAGPLIRLKTDELFNYLGATVGL